MATKRDRSQHEIPELTAGQLAAVDTLIAGGTDQEAAAIASVHRSTLNAWKNHHPAFIAALSYRRREIFESSRERMRSLVPKALDRLERDLSDPLSAAGSRAAVRIVQAAISGDLPQDAGPTDPAAVLDGLARRRRPRSVSEIVTSYDEDEAGPITDAERRETLDTLRDVGAFEES